MQAIATEFGYSEVTFVLPPENPENTARVRIFTPTTEVPFAGHPNVGTAFVLGRQQEIFGRKPGGALRFEEKAGLVEVTLLGSDGIVTGARIVAPQALQIGPAIDAATIAACHRCARTTSSTEIIRRCAFRSDCPSPSLRCATLRPFREPGRTSRPSRRRISAIRLRKTASACFSMPARASGPAR